MDFNTFLRKYIKFESCDDSIKEYIKLRSVDFPQIRSLEKKGNIHIETLIDNNVIWINISSSVQLEYHNSDVHYNYLDSDINYNYLDFALKYIYNSFQVKKLIYNINYPIYTYSSYDGGPCKDISNIYNVSFDYAQFKADNRFFAEELTAYVFKPKRLLQLCEDYEIDFDVLMNIY